MAVGLAALALVVTFSMFRQGGDDEAPAAGLPRASDYHSLLVSPSDPQKLMLGTHNGLYVSRDGGTTWRFAALPAHDAMNLAGSGPAKLWVAGHDLLKESIDGGRTWANLPASGLPALDVHGFAVDPRNANRLFAAVAGHGLFRSTDSGRSFSRISRDVGAGVMALGVTQDGRVLAGDMNRGLLASADGGSGWKVTLDRQVFGVAIDPRDPERLVAAGAGIALSTDGGRTWRSVLSLPGGAGPVAWSRSDPTRVYAISFDGTLYRSGDGGENWEIVSKRRST